MNDRAIRVFVSHRHSDRESAKLLSEYLLEALDLRQQNIRCTSAPGFGLPFGESISSSLRGDVDGTLGFIALLTEDSLASTWVKFELGAAWGLQKQVIPILGPGLHASDERIGPLRELRCIAIDEADATMSILDAVVQLASSLEVPYKPGGRTQDLLERFVRSYREDGTAHAVFDGTTCDFIAPRPEKKVGRNINVRIALKGVPEDGFVWLAVEDARLGLIWPKGSRAFSAQDGEHAVHIVEGGHPAPGALGILAFGVGRSGDAKIRRWAKAGEESGHFPGLRLDAIPGAVQLASVRGLTLDEKRR